MMTLLAVALVIGVLVYAFAPGEEQAQRSARANRYVRRAAALALSLVIMPIALVNVVFGFRPITWLLKGLAALQRRIDPEFLSRD